MIRIILWRIDGTGEWTEGVLHGFQQDKAVVETLKTGELQLVPVTPSTLKFKMLTTEWVDMQVRAQQEQSARQAGIVTAPNLNFGKVR
jgi:hypothetical protein